jgi:hypothetical protein
MRPGRTTAALAGALAVAVGLEVWLRWPAPPDEVGRLPEFSPADVSVVRISKGDDEWTLSRRGDGWFLPSDRPADAGRVGELLAGLSRGVPLDAQVDRGSFENYGLAGADPVRVDVLGDADRAISSVVVGFDAGGGATWVRKPGDDAVFRARIGGRSRYDRPLPAWRDRVVVAISDLRAIHVDRPGESYVLRAGQPWTLDGDPAFEVDPTIAREVARVLGRLTALDVATLDALGDAPPIAHVGLESASGTLGLRVWGSAVAIDGGDVAFRVAPALTALLAGPQEVWANRTFWTLDPTAVNELRLDEAERVILARQPGGWIAVEPVGVVVDPQRAAALAGFLASPSVAEWVPAPTGRVFSEGIRVVVAAGEDRRTIEVGDPVPGRPAGKEAVFVRDARHPDRVGTWSAGTWAQLRAGFGR